VGKETDILVDRKGRFPGQMIGKTPWLQSVHVQTEAAIGDVIRVELTSAGPNSLSGSLLTRVAA
jgi:tRNA-2-methylthio-N6-dimethylallyladenosine synthase